MNRLELIKELLTTANELDDANYGHEAASLTRIARKIYAYDYMEEAHNDLAQLITNYLNTWNKLFTSIYTLPPYVTTPPPRTHAILNAVEEVNNSSDLFPLYEQAAKYFAPHIANTIQALVDQCIEQHIKTVINFNYLAPEFFRHQINSIVNHVWNIVGDEIYDHHNRALSASGIDEDEPDDFNDHYPRR